MTGEVEALRGTISSGGRQSRRQKAPAKRLFALLVPLVLSLCLMASSAPQASALDYGLAAAGSQAGTDYEMEAVSRSGAKYWRFGLDCFAWYSNQSGIWQQWDHNFELAWERGITVLPTLSSRCTMGVIELPSRSEWEPAGSAWQNFAKAVVQHYGINGSFWSGKSNPKPVENWEIQNEPNLGERGIDGYADAKTYAEFFKKIAESLQAAQGSFFTTHSLVGGLYYGNINNGPSRTPHTFMQEMNSKFPAVKPWVYGVAIHPYEFGANSNLNIWADINEARSDVNAYIGFNKPLWITEIGWPVEGHGVDVNIDASLSEQEGAVHDLFNWVQQEASGKNIQALIFYMYRDDALGTGDWAHFCGLRSAQPAARYSEKTFRPAWYAFQEEVGASKWPVPPLAETQAATNIGTESATLNGVVNPHNLPTGYHFEWGTVENGYSWSVPGSDQDAGWKEGTVSENYVLTGLQPNTTYHYRIVGTNENNDIAGGGNRSFTTLQTTPAVVVDGSGVEHVYNRSSGGQLEEWFQIGTRWSKRLWGPTGNLAGSPSAVVDPSGKIWVYFRNTKGQLRNWWFQGTNFAEEEHGYENRMAGDPAVIVDKEGKRWVYFKGTNGTLRNWWFQGVNWAEEEHAYANTVGGDPSAFEDKEGKRWVYFRGTNGTLRNWWFQGANWAEEEHAYANTVGGDVSAFEDKEGKRWVYFKGTDGTLRSWWFQGVNWNEEVHGAANAVGGDPSAFEDTEGKRWAYFRGANGQLKAWWFKGASKAEESIGAVGAAGEPKGIARPSGKREVFYFNSAGAPFRWRFGPSEAALDTLASLLPFATSSQWATWDPAYTLGLADVNGDGKDDIVGRGPTADVRVKLSTGSSFGTGTLWKASWDAAWTLQLADVNGDGKADIVGRNPSAAEVRVALSTGSSFGTASQWTTWNTGYTLQLADVNGDGKDDIVGRGPTGDRQVGLSTGSGFAASTSWGTWGTSFTFVLADVNGDGRADTVGRESGGSQVRVGLSTGSGFSASSQWTFWSSAYTGELADVSGDGKTDIVGRGPAGDVQVGLSTASIFAAWSEWTQWSSAYSTAFADVSGDGRADIVGRNSAGTVQVGLSVK
jgi:hypothetical protein